MNRLPMMNEKHIVIDLETVDLLPTAGILSIGASVFVPQDILGGSPVEREFYINVDVSTCIEKGMTFSWDTLYWWFKQDAKAGSDLQENKNDIVWALRELNDFIRTDIDIHIWGNPSKFDISILENAYRLCGMGEPWDRKEVRDLVTLEGMIGKGNKEKIKKNIHTELLESSIKHNDLSDANIEAYRISEALGILLC